MQALPAGRAAARRRNAGDDICAVNRLLVEAGCASAHLAILEHGQEGSDGRRPQVDCQAQRRLCLFIAVAGAEIFVGINHNRREHDLRITLQTGPAGQAIVQGQLALGQVLPFDFIGRGYARLRQYLALSAGAPPGAGLL